jgi:hypothetical protein
VTPFKIRTGENTIGDDEDWDTSPSVIPSKKKVMPAKVTKKVVGNVAFITSLEQIDDMITPIHKKKKSVSRANSPKPMPSPNKKRDESPSKLSPQAMYKMEDQVYEISKEQR